MSGAKIPREPRIMPLGLALSWQAARDPEAPALTMGSRTYSRGELDRAANRLARDIAARGVRENDRVAVMLPTGPDHQIACFAIWKLGATVIPLSPMLVDREIRELVELASPKLIIGADPERLADFTVLPVGHRPDPLLSDEPLPGAVASIWKISSSGGSTGTPKLISENQPSVVDPANPLPILRLRARDVMFHPAASYHNASFTQTNWALCWGCHVILMERFDALEWLKTVDRYRVNWAYLVPTMMSRILALPAEVRARFDVSSLRMVMHMAAPCPAWVKQAWIDWVGAEIVWEIYAGTEGYGATTIGGNEWVEHRGSVGKAPPGTSVRTDDGVKLPPGEIGTIYFGPAPANPMGHPTESRTYGDAGWLDEDGYLYLADRRSDMILSGGVNIYPVEIEGIVEKWPGVVVCAVIGLPDEDLGARVHAIVELGTGIEPPDLDEFQGFLSANLARNKIPHTCEFTHEALRDEAGKLRRVRLRDARLGGLVAGQLHALRQRRSRIANN